jgi:hypothetical protein
MKFISIAAVAALTISQAMAADSVPSDIAAFTREYLEAMQAKGLAGVAPLLHPEAQESLRSQLLDMYRKDKSGYQREAAFGDDVTIDELEAMSAEQFLAKAMSATADRTGDVGKMMKSIDIIGVVRDGETVHVVSRSVADVFGQKVTSIVVTPLRRYNNRWRALLTSTTEGKPTPAPRSTIGEVPPLPPPPPPRR